MSVASSQHRGPWNAPVMTCTNHWTMGKWVPNRKLDSARQRDRVSIDQPFGCLENRCSLWREWAAVFFCADDGARHIMTTSTGKRKSTGKRLRFSVFKRDNFTCQYCGAQPPDVVLVADHITPDALGGETSIDNLVTACEACNQGKADIPLGTVTPRMDADLAYLETMQEIAELKRYQVAVKERVALHAQIVESLQDIWQDTTGFDWAPTPEFLHQLLDWNDPKVIERAIRITAGKFQARVFTANSNRWIPYLRGVIRKLSEEA